MIFCAIDISAKKEGNMDKTDSSTSPITFIVTTEYWYDRKAGLPGFGETEISGKIEIETGSSNNFVFIWEKIRHKKGDPFIKIRSKIGSLIVDPHMKPAKDQPDCLHGAWRISGVIHSLATAYQRDLQVVQHCYENTDGEKDCHKNIWISRITHESKTNLDVNEITAVRQFCRIFAEKEKEK